MYNDEYAAFVDGITGSDRMRLRLPIIPDPDRGDMAEVQRLRSALEFIASDVRCCSLDVASGTAKATLSYKKEGE